MEYFILETDKRYVPPYPLGWYGKLDARMKEETGAFHLPNHTIFFIEENMQMVFTDVIVSPCFMVSRTVMNTILLYDHSIQFERIIFFSRERKRSEAYYIPILEKISCLSEKTEFNKDKSAIKHAKVAKEKLTGRPIVQAEGVNCTCVLICLDLAESILRRKTVGVGLRKVENV